MAKKDKKKVSKIKIKKKLWCKIISPKIFGSKEIGESYLQAPEKALGRKLKSNLKDLTGNVKDQNVYVSMQVNKIDGSMLKTAVVGYELTPSYIKRAVRKNTSRIDDHFRFTTKGGKNVVIKTLMVTFGTCQRSVRTTLSKELKELLEPEVNKNDFSGFISLLVNRKILMEAKRKLKKVYPLKEVSVRVIKLMEKGIIQEEIVVEDKTKEEVKEQPVSKEQSKEETIVETPVEKPVEKPVETPVETPKIEEKEE